MDLLLAAFEPKLAGLLADGEAALAMDDPLAGFSAFLERFGAIQADDRGFVDFLSMRFPTDERTETMNDRVCALTHAVLARAQAAGVVRPDVTLADVIALIWANARIVEATREAAPRAWRRHLALVIDGFRADGPLPEPPMTDEQLHAAMARLSA